MPGFADALVNLAARTAGIRTAARKKAGRPPRMAIETLRVQATARGLKEMFPGLFDRLHLVGSRLRHREARDLDFVAVTSEKSVQGRNATVPVGDMKINLFLSSPADVETHILEFGLGLDNIRWKKTARKKGFKLNRFGLWKGAVKVTGSMKKIAALLGMPLKPHLLWSLEHPY